MISRARPQALAARMCMYMSTRGSWMPGPSRAQRSARNVGMVWVSVQWGNIYIHHIRVRHLPAAGRMAIAACCKIRRGAVALERGTWRRSLAVDLVITGPSRGSMIPFPHSPHRTRDAVVCRRPLPETHSWLARMQPVAPLLSTVHRHCPTRGMRHWWRCAGSEECRMTLAHVSAGDVDGDRSPPPH